MIWYFRIAGVIALLVLGWQVSQWRTRAIEADALEKKVERLKGEAAEAAQKARDAEIAKALAEARELDHQEVARAKANDIKARSVKIVERDCRFGPDSIRLLNDAGGYPITVPGSPGVAVAGR